MITLVEAAKEMEKILLRLERERARKIKKGKESESIFASMKGQLRSPCSGKIISTFGEVIDKKTYLKSFNPGISIKGKGKRDVYCICWTFERIWEVCYYKS